VFGFGYDYGEGIGVDFASCKRAHTF